MYAIFLLFSLLPSSAAGPLPDDGIIRVRSARGFVETVSALERGISARGLTVFARVDHAANARAAAMELRPTMLFVFGAPQVGTRLMQCVQTAAIDLPVRALVWEDGDGAVWVGYVDPGHLADRHGLQGCGSTVARLAEALAGIAAEAAGGAGEAFGSGRSGQAERRFRERDAAGGTRRAAFPLRK